MTNRGVESLVVPSAAAAEWRALAASLRRLGSAPACAQDPEAWWSKRPEDVDAARAACRACPVRRDCAAYAVAAGEHADGLWGGLTGGERADVVARGVA